MADYVESSVFTDYALKKINSNLIQEYEDFNFSKIKIGNKAGVLDPSRVDLTNDIYSLDITSYEINDNKFTLHCTIPEYIQGFYIREIGLYDTVDGLDYLFSLSVIDTVKPSYLPYDLIITLDINLVVVDIYPTYPELVVNDVEHASITSLDNLSYTLSDVTTNMERVIENNTVSIGYNTAQVFYEKQLDIDYYTQSFVNCSAYSKILKSIGYSYITDCFFNFKDNGYLFYKIRNLVNYNQCISVNNGLVSSSSDKVYFDSVTGSTLSVQADLGSLTEGIIVGKLDISEGKFFFNFKVENDNIVFVLYSNTGFYEISYSIQTEEVYIENNDYNSFVVTFNGSFIEPEMFMYINGEKVTVVENIVEFTGLTSYKSIPLVNYSYLADGSLSHNETFKIGSIINFNKVLSSDEIFLLYTVNLA